MANKKPKSKSHPNKVHENYKVEGDKLSRTKRTCPKCGNGVCMAEHKDRSSCGACKYTEFKSKSKE